MLQRAPLDLRARSGFALLETIFSFFLVAMLVMVVYNLLPTSYGATRQAGRESRADSVAQSVIEDYRSKPFRDLDPATLRLAPVEAGGVTYLPVVRITAGTGPGGDKVRHLESTVSWTWRGQSRQVQYDLEVVDVPR